MRGRKLVAVRTVRFSVYRFRYLSPREGTETSIGMVLKSLWCVQMPYSPGGDGNRLAISCGNLFWTFKYLTPREGTEKEPSMRQYSKLVAVQIYQASCLTHHSVQIPCSPRGDGNQLVEFVHFHCLPFRHPTPREGTEALDMKYHHTHSMNSKMTKSPWGA